LAGRAVETTRKAIPQRTIRAELSQAAPVLGDPSKLLQALEFVLLYACEHAHQEVTVRVSPVGAAAVEGVVLDDGAHLSEEQLQRLFVPFAVSRLALAEVGLVLAQRLIGLHGGRLEGANRPEGGLLLRVTLPQAGEKK
jgi:signal transduction histidine kinase